MLEQEMLYLFECCNPFNFCQFLIKPNLVYKSNNYRGFFCALSIFLNYLKSSYKQGRFPFHYKFRLKFREISSDECNSISGLTAVSEFPTKRTTSRSIPEFSKISSWNFLFIQLQQINGILETFRGNFLFVCSRSEICGIFGRVECTPDDNRA